ncbi:HNH endonuclease [Natrarchaeobaculum aegyptiacum]|uniref:Uncharacterized protein n=1 Tax=Natrarchaeobaculum aegyptiacum TaxID=745377 RepID=A0A2Z2HXY6_9EURY|nr:hypothetical protein [Natrarchaeobaculum aegyptiacum]ARS88328.1 hypothetical protein B1756_00165 [Natrarchaeobaculum aegyptiacum]
MTEGEWHGDRAAVLERDEHTCRRCGTTVDEDPAGLRLYPVGDVPREGAIHQSALVTVCTSCFGALRAEPQDGGYDDATLFDLVRKATEREGVTVTAVAAFASLTTGLPDALEESGAENEAAPASPADIADIAAEYRQARREVLLAIDSVDATLEHLHAVDSDALEADLADALREFTGTTTKLQSELRGIVALGETVVAGLERCPGCFDPLVPGNHICAVCGLERVDVDDWTTTDEAGERVVQFEALYGAINQTLQTASGTTEALTERTAIVAEQLQSEQARLE